MNYYVMNNYVFKRKQILSIAYISMSDYGANLITFETTWLYSSLSEPSASTPFRSPHWTATNYSDQYRILSEPNRSLVFCCCCSRSIRRNI